MTPDELRAHGHAVVDWVADYLAGLDERDVQPSVRPGQIRDLIPPTPPPQSEPFQVLLADLDRVVLPGITHWQHPGWFAYFPTGASGESILAEFVSAALGAQGMLWSTSPAVTEVESAVMDWMVDLLGLPPAWRMDTGPGGGVLQVSASDSTHLALVLARERARASADGPVSVDDQVVYASSQAHSSVEKGARVAGFRHVRLIDVDRCFALRVDALAEAIANDIAAGLRPTFVCAAVGTTAAGAVDDVAAIASLAREQEMWCHVDAAWAGAAMVCPEHRSHQAGLEQVDSYVMNPHKWLLTNFDCSVFYVADRTALVAAMRIDPAYLAPLGSDRIDVVDYRDWQVPLGRRFRALKLWWVLRSYGVEGLRAMIRDHCAWAADLDARIVAHPRLEIVAPTRFSLVTFAHTGGDAATAAIVAAIHADGRAAVTPTTLAGRRVIRVSIGTQRTTAAHVDALWGTIEATA